MKFLIAMTLVLSLTQCTSQPSEPVDQPPEPETRQSDTRPPSITIASPTNGTEVVLGDTIDISGEAQDDTRLVLVVANIGKVKGLGQWTLSIPTVGRAEGTLHVEVTARDDAGNVAAASVDVLLKAPTPPVATLTGAPLALTNTSSIGVTVGGTGVTQYRASLDGEAFGPPISVATPIAATGLVDGAHVLQVVGGDRFNHFQEDPSEVVWTVDTLSPTAELSHTPPAMTTLTSLDVAVAGSGVVSYQYRLDPPSDWTADIAKSVPIMATGLTDGSHRLEVAGRDAAGNLQEQPTIVQWTVDTFPPTAELSRTPPAITTLASLDVAVAGSGVVSYQYRLDPPSDWTADIARALPIVASGLTDGSHRLEVAGRDAAGNLQEQPTIVEWSIDTSVPVAVLSNLPSGQTQATAINVSVAGTGVLTYRSSLDGGSYSASTPLSAPITATGLRDGLHSLSVLGSNSAAVEQLVATTHAWTINTPPMILSSPASITRAVGASGSFSVSATLTNGGSGTLSYQWKRGSTNVGGNSDVLTIASVDASDAGEYSCIVTHLENTTTTQVTSGSATLTVNVAPTITTQPASLTVVEDDPVAFSVAASGSGTLSYQWQKNTVDIVGATGSTYGYPHGESTDVGSYRVIVTNTLNATTTTTVSDSATLTVTPNPTPLSITCANDRLPVLANTPILVTFNRAVMPPVVTTAQPHQETLSIDEKTLTISAPSGQWTPASHQRLTVQASTLSGQSATADCYVDFVPSTATTLYVTAGTGPGSGTLASPYSSIGAALANPAPRKLIYVSQGTYAGSLALQPNVSLYGGFAAGFALRNTQTYATRITRASSGVAGSPNTAEPTVSCTAVGKEVVLDGFEIQAPDGNAGGGSDYRTSISMASGCNAVVRGNLLTAPLDPDVEWSAGVWIGNAAGTIAFNRITDEEGSLRPGIRGLDVGLANIEGNVVDFKSIGGARAGIALYLSASTTGPRIANNTINIKDNQGSGFYAPYGIYLANADSAASLTVEDNTVTVTNAVDGNGFYSDGTADATRTSVTVSCSATCIGIQGARDAVENTVAVSGTGATCFGLYEGEQRMVGNTISAPCGRGISSTNPTVTLVDGNTVTASAAGIYLPNLNSPVAVTANVVTGGIDVSGTSAQLTIADNTVHAAAGTALSVDFPGPTCANSLIERNRVSTATASGSNGISLATAGCISVRNNLVAAAVAVNVAGSARIESNTLAARSVGVQVDSGSPVITNNIITGPGSAGVFTQAAASGTTITYNDIFNFSAATAGSAALGLNNINLDPGIDPNGADNDYATWADNDFTPLSTSCSIVGGAFNSVGKDILRADRTTGGACVGVGDGTSMGAYEID